MCLHDYYFGKVFNLAKTLPNSNLVAAAVALTHGFSRGETRHERPYITLTPAASNHQKGRAHTNSTNTAAAVALTHGFSRGKTRHEKPGTTHKLTARNHQKRPETHTAAAAAVNPRLQPWENSIRHPGHHYHNLSLHFFLCKMRFQLLQAHGHHLLVQLAELAGHTGLAPGAAVGNEFFQAFEQPEG